MNNYITSYDLFVPSPESYGDKILLLRNPSDIETVNKRLALLDWEGYRAEPQCYLMSQLPHRAGMELYISIIGLIILIVALTNYFFIQHQFFCQPHTRNNPQTMPGRKEQQHLRIVIH